MKKKNNKPQCPHCLEKNINWCQTSYFDSEFTEALPVFKKLKFGELLKCPECKAVWFIDDEKQNMDIVRRGQMKVIEEWSLLNLSLDADQMKLLKEIGATPPDLYGNMSEFISIPCKCTFKDGKTSDFCIISIQKKPPIGICYQKEAIFYYVSDVVKIEKSEYTLPLKVRIATSQAEERRMSYAPTVLQAPDKKNYIVNWTNHFFRLKDIKGRDMKIHKNQDNPEGDFYSPDFAETMVVTDWTPDCKIFY